MDRYGKEHFNQSDEAINNIKSLYHKKKFILPSGIIVHKQGYETNFLHYVFDNNLLQESDITYYVKGIKYMAIDNKIRYYFPDFYIERLNLIIECKSTWTIITDKNLKLKESAVKNLGYNYICILNNNFTEFLELIKK